ncbi:unnamed protein product [Bemisia tabaci]|uniref:Cytidine deaminase n=1 Tax=Bemisia tabaci TaxID=7038 RepID=A0A9P0A140_BEMTA|nr:PREDICTED: cytidine deaminase-like [Bemisia tabaci]CAH0381787.1 unnamed protein product [Bemisia tabaci]
MSSDNSTCKIVPMQDLEADVQDLCRLSIEARKASYSPYSQFAVGAALRCTNGKLYTGCNVENASYSIGICAERTAIVKAVSDSFQKFTAIAVSAVLRNEFVSPCGACRQFISEFAKERNIDVYLVNPELNNVCVTSISQLLPLSFQF